MNQPVNQPSDMSDVTILDDQSNLPVELHGTPAAVSALFGAMAAARSEYDPILKDRTGQIGQQKFKYATLPEILFAVTPALARHGVALLQPLTLVEGRPRITTILAGHGAHVMAKLDLPKVLGVDAIEDFGPQCLAGVKCLGAVTTYFRRYAIQSLLSVAGDDEATNDADNDARGDFQARQPGKPAATPAGPKDAPKTQAPPKAPAPPKEAPKPPPAKEEPPKAAPQPPPAKDPSRPSSPPPAASEELPGDGPQPLTGDKALQDRIRDAARAAKLNAAALNAHANAAIGSPLFVTNPGGKLDWNETLTVEDGETVLAALMRGES